MSTNFGLIPDQRMYERVGFLKLDKSTLEQWQIEQHCDFFDMKQFAGEGNIGHMIEQVKISADQIFSVSE